MKKHQHPDGWNWKKVSIKKKEEKKNLTAMPCLCCAAPYVERKKFFGKGKQNREREKKTFFFFFFFYRTMIRRGLNFAPTARHSPQLPRFPALKAQSVQKPAIHSVHAKEFPIGEGFSQAAQIRHRLDGENIDWRDEVGDAVSIGAWDEDAVVGGDGGVCWSKVRVDEKQTGI